MQYGIRLGFARGVALPRGIKSAKKRTTAAAGNSIRPVAAGLIYALVLGFAGPASAQTPKFDLADIRSAVLGPPQARAESAAADREDGGAFSALLAYADELQAEQPGLIRGDAPGSNAEAGRDHAFAALAAFARQIEARQGREGPGGERRAR
jgi:hypothetical protein